METVEQSAAPARARAVYEPYSPDFDVDPHAQYRALREQDPMHWWEQSQAWVLSRYEDVAPLLRDRRLSVRYKDWELSRERTGGGPATRAFVEVLENGLFGLGEAGHARLRKLVAPAFTPRAIEARRARVQTTVDEVLEGLAPGDRVDIAERFAEKIPLRVIAEVLGVPRPDTETFRKFAVSVTAATTAPWLSDEELEALVAPVPEGLALVRALIEERRAHPQNDMLSELVSLEEEGERLATLELLSLVAGLIIAGSETTVHLITFGVMNLLRHPDQLKLLLDEPLLARAAVDELLRYDLFGRMGSVRFALEDIALHGRTIRKGQMVNLLVASALRDPAVFPNADELDLRRDNSQSIAFGVGPHYCMGASLAKLEGEIALGTLFRRFPNTLLDGEPVFGMHMVMRRLQSLPIKLG